MAKEKTKKFAYFLVADNDTIVATALTLKELMKSAEIDDDVYKTEFLGKVAITYTLITKKK
jgi:hypothetical protein